MPVCLPALRKQRRSHEQFFSSESERCWRQPLRKEDARHLAGQARFVADIPFERGLEAAIIRSPVAHGYLKSVDPGVLPEGCRVYTAADFPDLRPIRAVPRVPGFKASDFPIFATDKVRYVGQPIGICVAPTAALAEDIAQQVIVEIDELPAVVDTREASTRVDPLLHESWGDNVFIERDVDGGDIETARSAADVTVTNEFRLNRHAAIPLENRAVLAVWDSRRDELTLNLSTQGPHLMRVGIAECLGLKERQLRVVSPDVGGGFGSRTG